MSLATFILESQILTEAKSLPFASWNMTKLEGTREALYNYVKGYTPNSIGFSFGTTPMALYSTEELCLAFICALNPAALNISVTQAESIITDIRLNIIAEKPATERVTLLSNKLAAMQQAQKEIEAGTYKPPIDAALKDPAPQQGKGTLSLTESIKAALSSPLFWVFAVYILYRIIKNRKPNEQ